MNGIFEAENMTIFEKGISEIWGNSNIKPEIKIYNSNYLGLDYVRFATARDQFKVLFYRPKIFILVFWDEEEIFAEEYSEFYPDFIDIFNPYTIEDPDFFEKIRKSGMYYSVYTNPSIGKEKEKELSEISLYPEFILKEDVDLLKKKYRDEENLDLILKGELYRGFIESVLKGEFYLKVPGRKVILDKLLNIFEGLEEKPADLLSKLFKAVK
jgi:hypothetical protein